MKVLRTLSHSLLHQHPCFISNIRTQSFSQRSMKIGIIQICCDSNKEKNLEKCQEFIRKSKREGAKMVFLPEAFDFLGKDTSETFSLSETLDGPLIDKYKTFAKEESVWLSLGGFHRKLPDPETRIANCHLVISDEGDIKASYEKTHLFDVDIPDQVQITESRYVRPGERLPVVISTPVGQLGLAICYDIRFPELSTALREAGAELITYPSAFSLQTGKAGHWEILLRARAIETQCYVIAAAQCGRHNEKRASFGHAMVVDPWGRVLCDLENEEGVATVDIDLEKMHEVRRNMPVMSQRRRDLYPSITAQPEQPDLDASLSFGDKIISKDHIFYRSARCFAFVNLSPVVPGHVLVSPVRVTTRLKDLTEAEICDLYRAVHRVAQQMEELHETSSLTVVCQDGPHAGQTVKHVHVHILPRRENDFAENDQIYEELEERSQTTRKMRTDKDMSAEAAVLRNLFYKCH